MMKIQVVITETDLLIYSPFEAKELIKSVPGRKWNPDLKAWTVPTNLLAHVKRTLSAWPGGVTYDDNRDRAPGAQTTDWAEAMLVALPEHLQHPAYKALSRVLHPDIGGDSEQMKNLNSAWNKRKKAA